MMTKLIHKGKEYETGKYYYFYDDVSDDGFVSPLLGTLTAEAKPFIAGGSDWAFCSEVSLDALGKIADESIELEDGEVYRFKLKETTNCLLGTYDKTNDWFNLGENRVHPKMDCENFIKLVPDVR